MQRMSIGRQFFRYVTQNIFGMLGISCYIIADTFFIARAAGADGMTVLNLVLPVYSVIYAIGAMVGVGSSTRFSILRAQKDVSADAYFSNALWFVCGTGVLGILSGIFLPDKILAWMGGDAGIVALGTGYTRIFLLFTPFFMLNRVISDFVRNDNAPATAMIATLTGSISNIFMDYLFMFPMGMGLEGAALATGVSPVISILLCGRHFFGEHNTIRLQILPPSIKRLLQACRLGVAAFIGEISSGITTAVFNFLILGLVGNVGVAAYGVVANYALVAVAVQNGVAQGSQPLISSFYGAGDRTSAGKVLRLGCVVSTGIAVALLAGTYLFTDPLVAFFNSEQSVELAGYAGTGLRLYVIGFLFAGWNITASGFLSATERAKEAFTVSILRGFAAIVGCSFLLAHIFGLYGVWLAFPAAELLTTVVLVMLQKKMSADTAGGSTH